MGLGGRIVMIGDAAAPMGHFGRAALEPRSAFHGEAMGGGFACPNQGRKSSPGWSGRSLVGKENEKKDTQEICVPCVSRHYLAV